MKKTSDVIISGAGIAGIAVAHQLSTKYGLRNVVVIDRHGALSATSAVSTECFRNVWSKKEMSDLMNRSIDILDEVSACESVMRNSLRGTTMIPFYFSVSILLRSHFYL